MYLKFVLVLFFQLFSINNSIVLPNPPIFPPPKVIKIGPTQPSLPVQRPSMNPNCFHF